MKKFLFLIGISGSGKSTYAKKLLNSDDGYFVISRDKMRNLLFGYDDSNIWEYYYLPAKTISKSEKLVSQKINIILRDVILGQNNIHTIIVDNTNLSMKYIKNFEYYNLPMKFKFFDIDLDEAIKRQDDRTRKVSKDVIEKQYEQYLNIKNELKEYNFHPGFISSNSPHNAVIVDLDGTLAIHSERSPFEYNKLLTDLPNESVVDVVKGLSEKYHIIICSGRESNDNVLENTKKWLSMYKIPYSKIYLRKNKDYRPDWIVKEEMWKDISRDFNIKFLIDDRNQVVDRARYLSLEVLQVNYSEF